MYGTTDNSDDVDVVLPEGLRVRPNEPIRTSFGSFRKLGSLKWKEWCFLVIGLVEIGASLGFALEKIVTASQSDTVSSNEDLVLAIVLSVNISFCFVYIIDGIMTEKPYEIIIFLIANVIVTGYVIGNYAYRCAKWSVSDKNNQTLFLENTTTTTTSATTQSMPNINFCVDAVKLSRLIITLVTSPPALVLGVIIARKYIDSGEFIFRIVGADTMLQTACKVLFAAISIIRLDLQLQISMLVLVLQQDIKDGISLTEALILALGMPFSILWAAGSYFSLRLENAKLLVLVVFTAVLEPIYIVYRMVLAGENVVSVDPEKLLSAVTFLFGAGALIVRSVHLFLLYKGWTNFHRGLKERVFN